MAMAQFTSPYNVEKRRFNEDQLLVAKSNGKDGAEVAPSQAVPLLYQDMELILFPHGSLRDCNGQVISQDHLIGKSVALYFADGKDPKCTSFLPFLLQFYKTVNEAGNHQKIEIIFVSLDTDQKSFESHRSHMPWLNIELADPLTQILKRHFRVIKEYEIPLFGAGPKCGLPCVVVIGSDGREAQFLHVNSGRDEGERALLRWDWRNTKFNAGRLLVRREG